jgi:D-alanyl-D-alanine carboxypeptidase (penicillin-binding protein 5/6)
MTDTLSPHGYGRATLHARRRRRRAPFAAALVAAIAATVAAGVYYLRDDKDRAYLSTKGWPVRGQGAYQLGDQRAAASPGEQPVPIASLAKVMTAYVLLQHYPLHDGELGRRFVVRSRDVADTAARRAQDQSVVDVRAGERITERASLMALLLPSANNIAVLMAREVSGSVAAFVAEMNETAHAIGMTDTTYSDPSGYDEQTVSTAVDQLRLAELVADNPALSAMMATRSYSLPVAGRVQNTNELLGQDGFVGMKTGSDDAAGGCFMFESWRHLNTGNVALIGVVLGQRGHNLITAGLYAAKQLVNRVAPQPATP